MCRLAKQKSNKVSFRINIPGKGFILEKLINPISTTPFLQPLSSPWVSYKSKLKAYHLVSVISSIKIN